MATTKTEETKSKGLRKGILLSVTFTTIILAVLAVALFNSNAISSKQKKAITSLFHQPEQEKLFKLDDFTVKLSDGTMAQISMNIGYIGNADTELTTNTPIIRDKIISVLMKLNADNLSSQSLENTKAMIANNIKPLVKTGQVQHIYIGNLITQ